LNDSGILLAAGKFGRLMGGWGRRSVNAHAHSDMQVSFNLGGFAVDYQLDDRVETLRPGHAVIIPSWQVHARNVRPGDPAFILVLSIPSAWLRENQPDARRLQGFSGCVPLPADVVELLERIRLGFQDLDGEVATESPPLIAALIEGLGRMGSGAASDAAAAPVPRSWDRRISRAVESLRGRKVGKLNVDDIAAEAGLSRTQFYRRFKECVGVSPLLFLNAARMDWAVARLIEGDEPLSEISDGLGFSSPGHFSRFFVTHTGETPVSYRRRSVELSGRSGKS
jgi:AraC family transcriptional regulator